MIIDVTDHYADNDDLTAFRNAIAAATPGDTVFVPSGTYALGLPEKEQDAVGANKWYVYLDLDVPELTLEVHPEAQLIFQPPADPEKEHWYFAVRLRANGINVVGGRWSAAPGHPLDGIVIASNIAAGGTPLTGTLIRGVELSDFKWGINAGGESQSTYIEQCDITAAGMWGVVVSSGDGIVVRDCRIADVMGKGPEGVDWPGSGIRVEPSAGLTVTNVRLLDNDIRNCESGISLCKPRVDNEFQVSNVSVCGNYVLGGPGVTQYGILLQRSIDNVLISGNRCEGARSVKGSSGIFVVGEGSRDTLIAHNACRDNNNGIYWHRKADEPQEGAIISSNVCRDNDVGLRITNAQDVVCANNLLAGNITDLVVNPPSSTLCGGAHPTGVTRMIVRAVSEDTIAAPGNREPNYIELSVTDATGTPVTGLEAGHIEVDAMVVGPGGAQVDVSAVSPARLPGCYHVEVVPIANETWKHGTYVFAVAVQRGAERGQTLARASMD